MEALQVRPSSTEHLPGPTTANPASYFDRVKSRLARIPTIPSNIVVPSISSEREPAESLSTVTTATITTESGGETSTAATSVLSLPQVFVVQKFHVSPSMPIDEKIQSIWTQQIRSRLSAVLLHRIPTGTCVQEFMMVGKRPDALKPTLVITCGDKQTKKRVEKSFKSLGWLQELLKANGIMFVTLVAKTSLSAGLALDPTNILRLSYSCSVKLPHDPAATSCGLPLVVNASEARPERHCTLGGLVIVNGEIFGLTARHPFKACFKPRTAHDEPNDIGQDLRLLEDEESSESSDEPFVFNDDEDDSLGSVSSLGSLSSASTASMPGLSPPDFLATSTDDLAQGQNISKAFSPLVTEPYDVVMPLPASQNVSSFEEPLQEYDWALVDVPPFSTTMLPNKIAHIDPRHDILIESTFSGSAHGEVTITIANIGAQLGYLHSSPVTLKVNESILDVQLISLEHVLPLGSSGAWVILGDQLCGFIVAIRQDIPWAYMTPIKPILEDIKRKFGTPDVRLPGRGEIESLAVQSRVSKTLAVEEQDGQASDSLDRQISEPTSASKTLFTFPTDLPTWVNRLGIPSETDIGSSNQQEEEIINEKSTMLEKAPETSMAVPPTSRPEFPGNVNKAERSTARHPRRASSPIRPEMFAPTVRDYFPFSSERPMHSGPVHSAISTASTLVPTLQDPGYYFKRTKPSSSVPQSLFQKTYTMPFTLWRRAETFLLRSEYRRRRPRRHSRCRRLRLVPFLYMPDYPDCYRYRYRALLLPWYYFRLPFYAVAIALLNILYFVVCSPILLWVIHRHRDVLEDEETLVRQRHESIEMLGPLPERLNDDRSINQRHSLYYTGNAPDYSYESNTDWTENILVAGNAGRS